MDYHGADTNFHYCGTFTVKALLNIGEKAAVEVQKSVIKSELSNASTTLEAYANILSNLRVRIIDAPDWWKSSRGGMTIDDEDALIELFELVMKQEDEWRAEVKAKANPEGETKGN
jgi:hypothetical protein